MIKEYNVKVEKLYEKASFMEKCFKVCKWLKKRYDLPHKQVTMTYYFTKEQQESTNDEVTIKFEFHD